jgi:hypothetical protein
LASSLRGSQQFERSLLRQRVGEIAQDEPVTTTAEADDTRRGTHGIVSVVVQVGTATEAARLCIPFLGTRTLASGYHFKS